MNLDVVTYNIRKGKGARGVPPGLDLLSSHLLDLRPDLLLCQEVFHSALELAHHQSTLIAQTLELMHRYEPNAVHRRGHHGNTSFSRFPISRHENRDISTNRIEHRGVLYTRVHPEPGRSLHVFNTHFGLSQRQRVAQAKAIGAMIRELVDPADPLILAGDFNDWNGRVDPVILGESQLDNAMLALAMKDRVTFSTRRPLFSLDRIYYRGLHLRKIEVLREGPWHALSDHFPVRARFEVSFPDGAADSRRKR